MSGIKTGTEESDWTKSNLQKLLIALRTSIPQQERTHTYREGLKTIDWRQIAFPPFSPEACQEKWGEILQEMRKIRTLTELIVEAEDAICNPVQDKTYVEEHQLASEANNNSVLEFSKKYPKPLKCTSGSSLKRKRVSEDNTEGKRCKRTEDAEGMSAKPPFNGCFLYCVEQLASEFSKKPLLEVWAHRWRDLTETKRQEYRARCEKLKTHDWIKLSDNVMKLKYIDDQIRKKHTSKEISYRPSDSEDEDLEDNSNEKEDNIDLEEDEEEEEEEEDQEDVIMFEMYRW